jgi:hypothetical protein
MNHKTYEEAKRQTKKIANLLQEGNLTPEERQKFETLQAQLAGVLLHPWLPFGWARRLTMFVLLLIGVYGLMEGNNYLLLAWLFMLFFSPRFIGEFLRLIGMFLRSFK